MIVPSYISYHYFSLSSSHTESICAAIYSYHAYSPLVQPHQRINCIIERSRWKRRLIHDLYWERWICLPFVLLWSCGFLCADWNAYEYMTWRSKYKTTTILFFHSSSPISSCRSWWFGGRLSIGLSIPSERSFLHIDDYALKASKETTDHQVIYNKVQTQLTHGHDQYPVAALS